MESVVVNRAAAHCHTELATVSCCSSKGEGGNVVEHLEKNIWIPEQVRYDGLWWVVCLVKNLTPWRLHDSLVAGCKTHRWQPRHLHAVIPCLPRYPDVRVLEGFGKVVERLEKHLDTGAPPQTKPPGDHPPLPAWPDLAWCIAKRSPAVAVTLRSQTVSGCNPRLSLRK